MGDGFMVLFGYPNRQKKHAKNAVEAAMAMQACAEHLRPDWQKAGEGTDFQLRIGIATGHVLLRNVQDQGQSELRAIGTTVNLAARLESKTAPGKVLISQETYDEVKDLFACSRLAGLELKGFDDALTAYVVTKRLQVPRKARSQSRQSRKRPRSEDEHRLTPRMAMTLEVTYTLEDEQHRNRSLDISEGGIFIETKEPPPVGTVIEVFARIPTERGILPVTIQGRVARVSRKKEGHGMGIEFVYVQAGNASTIRYFVKEVYGLTGLSKTDIPHDGDQFFFRLDEPSEDMPFEHPAVKSEAFMGARVAHEFKRTARYGSEFSVVAVRVRLEAANRSNLDGIVTVLVRSIRDTDEVFFLPERGFLVLAPETMSNRIATLTRRMAGALNKFGQARGKHYVQMDVKLGSFSFDGHNAASPEEVVTLAFRGCS